MKRRSFIRSFFIATAVTAGSLRLSDSALRLGPKIMFSEPQFFDFAQQIGISAINEETGAYHAARFVRRRGIVHASTPYLEMNNEDIRQIEDCKEALIHYF